jgi:Domain of unknown function (DUF1707)
MAGPGDEMAAGAGGWGRLRASHADREQAIDVLKAAFVQGRLARDEFELRVGQVLASRTCADLAALTADIPAGLIAAQPPLPAREPTDKKAVKAIACVTAALMTLFAAGMMTTAGLDGVNPLGGLFLAAVFIPFVVIPLAALLLFHAWLERRATRQPSQGSPPGADGQASLHLPSADPAGQLPPIGDSQQHIAEAAPSRLTRPQRSAGSPRRWRPRGLLATGEMTVVQ